MSIDVPLLDREAYGEAYLDGSTDGDTTYHPQHNNGQMIVDGLHVSNIHAPSLMMMNCGLVPVNVCPAPQWLS